MRAYQFKIRDKNFVVDVESANFFEVDDIASEAISLMQRCATKEVKEKICQKYGHKPAKATIANLSRLKKEKVLFCQPKPADSYIKRRITDLTLNIVNSCNLRCRYCWNKAGSYGNLSGDNKKMGERVAFKAIDLLVKGSRGVKDLVVDFYGGEPLLNFELIKNVIGYCRKIQDRKGIKFRFLLATNGVLLDKEKGEYLIANGVDVAVSLDGPRKIQDKQRPFPDGTGSYDIVVNNIRLLSKKYRRRIVGRATFTPYSDEIVKTFKFLRDLEFDRIEVCESEKAGYGLEPNNQFFFSGPKGLSHLKSLYDGLVLFYTKEILGGRLTYANTYFNRFFKQLSRLYHIQSIVGTCSAGFTLMAVDMDGSIYPCTAFVGLPKFRIGTVEKGISEDKVRKFFDNKISSSEACNKCWAKRICRGCGSCYNLNYFSSKNLGQPDPYYCELFRYKTKLMIAMISDIAIKNPRLLDKVLIPEYYATRGKQ